MRRLSLAIALFAGLAGVLALPSASALAETTANLIENLRKSDDYRVRTQAALALGTSGDDAAVQPLCGAVANDANVTVKVAAAAALGKLGKPAAVPCLKAAAAKESAASVKTQIDKALASLDTGGGSSGGSGGAAAPAAPPPPAADSKFYVAIQVTNKTGRPAGDVDNLVRAAMQQKLLASRGYAVAPKGESPSAGGQVVKSKKLRGFLLMATVEAPVYGGGDLTQSISIALLTYPDKVLQGQFNPKLTQSGTPKSDPASETELMKMCAENAIESFQKVAASL